ncbi:hypothetical protein [Luteitalea sp.]|uniref:hypothetical protein n=1 Tax=Luteitalea sp. TaxID=2004800 RepID=UPI0025B9513D|nr:hypothetical protein [Luteitalea sp.]
MAAAFIQSTVASGTGGATLTLNGVAAGRSLVVKIAQFSAAVRTYAASSNLDGALTSAVAHNPGRAGAILYLHGCSAGNHTVTVSANTGTNAFEAVAEEWDGLDPLGTPTVDTFNTASNNGTHYSAQSGNIDTTGGAAISAVGVLNVSGSTLTAGASPAYTRITPAANAESVMFQYRVATSAVTDDRGEWTSSTPRQVTGCIAAFPEATGADTTLAASGTAAATTSAALTTALRAAASVDGSAAVTGALTTAIRPAASVTASATTAAALTTAIRAAAAVAASATVAADLSAGVGLGASITGTTTTTAALSTAIQAAASVTATATVSADLLAGSGLAATPTATATTTAALTTAIRAAGAATVTATVSAALSTSITCAGAVTGTATVAGALDTSTGLAAALVGSAMATGTLTTQIALAAIVATQATAVAALTAPSSNVPDVIVMGAITASTLATVGPITVSEAINVGTITQVGQS